MTQVTIEQALQIALSHHQAGRLPEAHTLYRQILAQQPNHPETLHMLGVLSGQTGRLDLALDLIRRAIALKPDYYEAHNNLGFALLKQGQPDAAIAAYRQAIALHPNFPGAYNNLGHALQVQGQFDAAIAAYRQALALNPDFPEAHNNLGDALQFQGHLEAAVAAFRQAVALHPQYAEAHSNLGNVLQALGRTDEALAAHRMALAVRPDASFKFNLSLALLLTGRFAEGWDLYEWRDKAPGAVPRRHFPQPLWNGDGLAGRTILIHCEQGLGDTLQFVRYLPLVARRGGRVILLCQDKLSALLQPIAGAVSVITDADPLPSFDVQCPLLSLPRIFHTTLDTIPADIPYLFAREDLVKQWGQELGTLPKFKVGICWSGNPRYHRDRDRSIPLASFELLASIPRVQLISLQKGPGAEQLAVVKNRFEVINLGDRLDAKSGPFMDTAAIMQNLDLMITVESSVAQLAGALGVPVWTLLSHSPDWRWLLNRSDSPWYPTMRLFRQPAPGDWNSVMQEVARALGQLAKLTPSQSGVAE